MIVTALMLAGLLLGLLGVAVVVLLAVLLREAWNLVFN